MKKLVFTALATVALAGPFFAGLPAHVAEAHPDCVAVDHNGDGYSDITDVSAVSSLPGGAGRTNVIVRNFGEAC